MKALFVGRGASVQCYYRCALPAMALGQDWIGLAGEPATGVQHVTGLVGGEVRRPEFSDYDVIVLQTPRAGWRTVLKALQQQGIKVLVEVDDDLRAVGKQQDHDFKRFFGRSQVEEIELNMRLSDGVICSTEYLARRYRRFNRKTWACPNGVDLGRYQLTRPYRDRINIGWAGGTGHRIALDAWLPAIVSTLDQHADTGFVTIGQPFADLIAERFPGGRCVSLPWMAIESYPAAMCLFDIAIAPAGPSLFFRGKSDLRFLEASALGIPIIADPSVYGDSVRHGDTGFVSGPADAAHYLQLLIESPRLRSEIGEAARSWVSEHRTIQAVAPAWARALDAVVG